MRLILRLALPFANHTTQAIELAKLDQDINYLKQKVIEKFKLSSSRFFLKFQRDGFWIRMSENMSIDFYDLTEKVIIYVEPIENLEELGVSDNNNITTKYFGRLGLLSTIQEEESKKKDLPSPFGKFSRSNSNFSSNGNLSDKEDQEFNINKYINQELEKLLKETKNKDLEAIINIMDSVPENIAESIIEEIKQRKKNLINELGKGGWNALHFAVFFGHTNLVKEFLSKWIVNINTKTHEGWTPLLLAINKNNFDLFQLILKQDQIKINEITSKGPPIHLACRHGKSYVQALLNRGADPLLKNEEGLIASDICTNDEILSILEAQIRENSQEKAKEKPIPQIDSSKPPIVIGWIYKTGPLIFNIKRRFFVLDPYDGTFIRYKEKEDYPLKPRAVIPLKDIINVQRIENSWIMKKELSYFEIVFSSKKIYACKYLSTAKEWVSFISKSAMFTRNMEDQLKKNKYNLQVIATISSNNIETPPPIFELKDEERPEDHETTKSTGSKNPRSPKNTAETEAKSKLHNKIMSTPDKNDKKLSFSKKEGKPAIGFKDFKVIRILGAGSFGKVYLVRKKDNNKIYAMKALKKRDLIVKKQLRYAVTEANVLKRANHPFVLKLHYSFQTPQFVYMILDYCSKGDLSLYLAQKITLTEEEAQFYLAEMLLAVEHLHSLDVLYRDLKPENLLIAPDGHVKIADFGLAKEKIGDNDATKSFCGSPAYLAPEMLKNKGTGKAADIYGLGAVFYEMITGAPPFYNDDIPKLYKNIQEAKLSFPDMTISEEAIDLMTKMLDKNPKTRIGVIDKSEIKNHPFFKNIDWNDVLAKKLIPPEILDFEEEREEEGEEFTLNDQDYEENNARINRVIDFSFERTEDQE